MMQGVKENGLEDSDKVVRSVLNQRHTQEMNELERQFTAQRKMMVDEAVNKVMEKYEKKREDLLKKHDAQLEALKVKITDSYNNKVC